MRVNLYTDAPKHNLALMKLSAWHKTQGHDVTFNLPIMPCDYSYASILFDWHKDMYNADEYGGPAFDHSVLPPEVEAMRPDYTLFPIDCSLGYTFRPCFRGCEFCKVKDMTHPDQEHHSIWEFHDCIPAPGEGDFIKASRGSSGRFKKICLLNNNTFFDKRWRETFEEIWDADLTLIDENGYDLRLMDEEKAEALRKTKFQGKIHYAWDRMRDEQKILEGLRVAPPGHVYVLIGYDTTREDDLYRCQKIVDLGHDPYIMPYNKTKEEKQFKRFIDSFIWRKFRTLQEAWGAYK